MKTLITLVGLIALSTNIQAGPVSFDNVSLFVDALVDVDGSFDSASGSLDIPPANASVDLPLFADVSQNSQAFSSSFIDGDDTSFFLDASTESFSSNGEPTEALAVAEFAGEILGEAGAYLFSIEFDVLNDLFFGGVDDFSEAGVFAEIIVDGLPVFSGSLMSPGGLNHRFKLEDLSLAFVNVFVTSESVARTPGASAFNLASAQLTVQTIPEPSTLFLLGTAIFGLQSRRVSKS